MSAPVAPDRPMDPRLAGLPALTARKLNNLPAAWLNELLEGMNK